MTGLDLCSRKRRQLSLVPSSVLAGNGKTAKAEAMAFLSLRQSLSFATGWAECDSTVDPCNECTNRVQCESGEDGMHIVAMDLSNNRLFGELPENLTGFPHLRVLLLSNSNNTSTDGNIEVEEENRNELEFFQASCLDYAFCNQLGGRCESKDTKVHFCNEDGKLPANELEAWTGLFDGMNGIKWKRCSNARANPCAHPDCVHCDSSQGQQTITGIHLSSNNVALTALELPSLAALSNLVDLDLSLNSKLSDLLPPQCHAGTCPNARQ
ncbi:hypothetical protein BASA81_018101 [Batrachochytrium salamandrivorans]|nr:hypothetical protein BASA81_018101 [Batrachochytrium salamandrivorans]